MISLFILKPNTRGMRYGIGTYINQLTGSLLTKEDINIFIVNYLSSEYKEFTIISKSIKLTEIHIPSPIAMLINEKQGQKYANRIVDLLAPIVQKCPNPIFQINHPDALPIVKHLKTQFSVPVVSVIHLALWQFIYDGNKQKFDQVWTTEREANADIIKTIEAEKELYEISDKVVSVTGYMKDFIMNYFNISEKKIEVIPNGIDKSVFHMINKDEKESVKQSFGFARDEIIILYSGRLDKGKGIYSLINAFNLVCKQCNNIRLVLAGEDSGANRISQYLGHCTNIWGKVTFTGFVEYEIINKLYQIADIGIIPSLYDHCPYVALEMIGYNVPLIISNTEGLNEILTKDQCILITPIVDNDGNITLEENDIADAILSFTRNESSITNYIISDYQDLMKTKFSSKRMGKEMYSLLLNLQTTEVQTCFS